MSPIENPHPHLGAFHLLPAEPGTCQECAVAHDPAMPHNAQSLFYQYHFFGQHGRWPTWKDALAHCTPAMQQAWIHELAVKGVIVVLDT